MHKQIYLIYFPSHHKKFVETAKKPRIRRSKNQPFSNTACFKYHLNGKKVNLKQKQTSLTKSAQTTTDSHSKTQNTKRKTHTQNM